ncbi:MAG: cyclic nucleotide-binding domain-containing protein [Pseudomonadota bacterium]
MGFWDTTIQFFWRDESLPVLVMALAVSFLLVHFRQEGRKSVLNTLMFFFACFALQFVSALIHALEFSTAAAIFHEVAVIGAGVAVIRLWGLLLFRIVLPVVNLRPPRIAEDIFVIITYIAWGLVRLRYAGLDLGSIVATSAMITAVVAFAMQDTLGNILGGLALQLDNSIEIGDWIKVDDVSGRVVDIRWRSTLVETRDWETVVFPNSQLMKSRFVVLGRRKKQAVQWRRWIWFNVALGVPPAKVIKTAEDAILRAQIGNVAKDPAPNCVFMEMDRGCARYALRYWLTDLAMDAPTDGAVRWHIYAALERAGIKLTVEEQHVHFIKENEKYEEAIHQRELLLRIKTLKRVQLFSQMTEDELRKLAENLKYTPFAKGDLITKQGTAAQHCLYIVIRGEAEVYLEGDEGERRSLNVLSKGSFFGEMSLMTGAPRAASVIAKTDVECYRLDKAAFEEIMRERPSIAEEVTQILVERRAELDQAHQSLDESAKRHALHHQHSEVLATVKRFFGL